MKNKTIELKSFYGLSQRKQDYYEQYIKLLKWGRKYPVRFIETFFNVELLDYQRYLISKTWVADNSLWLMCRNGSKTTCLSFYTLGRCVLFPNTEAWLISRTGSQSKELYTKMEKVAKKNLPSFPNLSDFILDESEKILHDDQSYEWTFPNGSSIHTLNGIPDNARGHRSTLNIYDESAFITEELFKATEPFLLQDSTFVTGVNLEERPDPPGNQRIFASSAGDVDSYFYSQYRDYFLRMMGGDSRYFVANIDADMLFDATMNGKVYPVSLIKREDVKRDLQKEPAKANREYYNKFDSDGGINQVFRRSLLIKNSEQRAPILFNKDGDKRFIFAYDPARTYDNSIVAIAELKEHPNGGYKAEICNCISLIDTRVKKKKPETTPDQIQAIKNMLLNYNGWNIPDYENIDSLCIDAGPGGGGTIIADLFMENWTGEDGVEHKGLIDPVISSDYVARFPQAVHKLRLVEPTRMKRIAFDNLRELLAQGRITFTEEFKKGDSTITIVEKVKGKDRTIEKPVSTEEALALINIELMKSELVNIYRKDTSNGYTYDLNPDLKGRNFDDRAYVCALIALRLSEINRAKLNKSPNSFNYLNYIYGTSNGVKNTNLFGSRFQGF